MTLLIVVDHPRDWPYDTPGATLCPARDYLDDPRHVPASGGLVLNLCKSYRYQRRGYYVSLLAEARGQQALPGVRTLEDVGQGRIVRLLTERLDASISAALDGIDPLSLELDVLFGATPDAARAPLARQLFEALGLPLLRARFERDAEPEAHPAASGRQPSASGRQPSASGRQRPASGQQRSASERQPADPERSPPARRRRWRLAAVRALAPTEVRLEDRPLMARAAAQWAAGLGAAARPGIAARRPGPPAVAILHDPQAPDPPSNPAALERFAAAAQALGMRCERLGRHDIDRLIEFDALFVRDTTHVNHYTYRFARRAAAQGLVVVDHPDAILRCTNKVFLHELLARHDIPVPRTLLVHRGNVDRIVPTLGLPCILKQPDSAFSLGVKKASTPDELARTVEELLHGSERIVAQEFLPTRFDWRIGVLDGRALFACQYFMAPGHWQVIKREHGREHDRQPSACRVEGRTLAFALHEVPPAVVELAARAARLVGDGLLGVDLKQAGDRVVVIEVNDNPNVDAGNEDAVLGEALYREVMGSFQRRIRAARRAAGEAGR